MAIATQLFQAWKRFRVGPGNDLVEPGDIIDLANPGWDLPRGRGSMLAEQRYGALVSEGVATVEPNPPGPPVFTPPTPEPRKEMVDAYTGSTVLDEDGEPVLEPAAPLFDCPHCVRQFPTEHGRKVHVGRYHKE